MTKNSLENFSSKYLFDKEQKTRFLISYCISVLYKSISKFAKIEEKDRLLDKNAFSEPVYCQKSQQTFSVLLVAVGEPDKQYRGCVQPVMLQLPHDIMDRLK